MEKLTNKAARQYLRRVRGLLPCSRKDKDRITGPLRQSITDFLAEQPEATLTTVQDRFGNPETVAAMCLEQIETPELLKKFRIRRRVWKTIIAVTVVILVTWTVFLVKSYLDLQYYIHNSHEVVIIKTEETFPCP